MIEVSRLHKRFGEVHAVAGVTFAAHDGSITGLLGPNGAGKTTALRAIYGLIRPDSGSIRVDGVDGIAEPMEARRRLGVLPDSHGLYPRLTSREHMRYFGRLQGLGGTALEERIAYLIGVLDMHEIADRRAAGFSQGERMKVALARALVHEPTNVVLDEPSNGLDVRSTRALRAQIRALADVGKCVLFSSHVMQEVSALCDVVYIMAKGEIVARGTAEELRARTGAASLEDAFVALTGGEPDPDTTRGETTPSPAPRRSA